MPKVIDDFRVWLHDYTIVPNLDFIFVGVTSFLAGLLAHSFVKL